MKLATINRDLMVNRNLLMEDRPAVDLSAEALAEVFSVFEDWKVLTRDDKRRILSTLSADIRVADYRVSELGLNPAIFGSNEVNHRATELLPQISIHG